MKRLVLPGSVIGLDGTRRYKQNPEPINFRDDRTNYGYLPNIDDDSRTGLSDDLRIDDSLGLADQWADPIFTPSREADREKIASDTERFLANGGSVTQVPAGQRVGIFEDFD